MANFENLKENLILNSSHIFSSPNIAINQVTFAVSIDGVHTDFSLSEFKNRIFVVVTQTGKLGCFYSVTKLNTSDFTNSPGEDIYTVKTLFGTQYEEENHTLARFLTEHTGINKPVVFAFCIKSVDANTAKRVCELINKHKTW